ncbi:MAG: bifunctional transaldolase/phosoglucose isomerase [Chloroflexi bacterium]|nr:bifunctional transaldolase/phosoglucose isomerase [Chloroflexota bacterium]
MRSGTHGRQPPVDVQQFGQSIWYDNIRRSLITSGELQRMIDQDGVLGITSNPTIFQKAIGGSSDYDSALMTMLELDPYDIYERLAVEDIQHALDLLRPIYDRTGGKDGYVSLEVSPLIANDTQSTANEAKRLFAAVGRPNAMIKIPATDAGIPAIEEAIAAGVNVNVTLIFSIDNYIQVAEAFIRGLERRHAEGQDVSNIASVASFFLSRIDVAVDRMLDNNIRAAQMRGDLGRVTLNNQLKGKSAIANAKIAYKRFKDMFYGKRFETLRDSGAMVQRLLWASTGTKNAAYADTMYVDSLIGPDTVNTVPPDTLKLFKDHGTAANTLLEHEIDEAQQIMDMLAEVGIDMSAVTLQLQTDGVEAFIDSFQDLLAHVEAKRDVMRTGVMAQQELTLGMYADSVKEAVAECTKDHSNARLWNLDGSLWKDNPAVIAKARSSLGWLNTRQTIDLERLQALADRAFEPKPTHLVLLGMGGSSLAPEALFNVFGSASGRPKFLLLDSTAPSAIRQLESQIDLERTVFVVSSKSGSTIETWSLYKYFFQRTGANGKQFIAITDAGSQLEAEAHARGFLDVLVNPSDVGGRYAALTYFGMGPAALLGIDFKRLATSAERMMIACGPNIPAEHHPGLWLGVIMGTLGKAGKDKITLHFSPSIVPFGPWVEQLIAESTGKEGKGLVPVVGATIGMPHDYSTDRLFVYVRVEGDQNEETDAGITMLKQAGHPVVTLHLKDTYALGGEFFRWAYAAAIAGKILGVNPFDEPNVGETKANTLRLLEAYSGVSALPRPEPILEAGSIQLYADDTMAKLIYDLCTQHQYERSTLSGMLAAQFNATVAGDYFALLAYLPQTSTTIALLEDVRRRLRHVSKRAVTLGFGPRYLHSTGQIHKGGASNGVFIQLTTDEDNLSIPDAGYGFGTLVAAQAAGDLEALQQRHRRAIRLHLLGDVAAGMDQILKAIDLAGERRR